MVAMLRMPEKGEIWDWGLNNDKIMEGRDEFVKRFHKGEESAAAAADLGGKLP